MGQPQPGQPYQPQQYQGQPYQGQYQPYPGQQPGAPAKKKRRVFLWVFLAIQALFVIWIIAGVASNTGNAVDCGSLTQDQCNDTRNAGTGIGVFLIIVVWFIVDFLIGLGYVIYRLAKRP